MEHAFAKVCGVFWTESLNKHQEDAIKYVVEEKEDVFVNCKCVTLSLRYSWPFCHLIPLDSFSLPLILSCLIVRPF